MGHHPGHLPHDASGDRSRGRTGRMTRQPGRAGDRAVASSSKSRSSVFFRVDHRYPHELIV